MAARLPVSWKNHHSSPRVRWKCTVSSAAISARAPKPEALRVNFATDTALEYEQQTFKKIELSQQKIKQKTFQECIFTQCTLNEVSFDNCKFFKCTFKDCDLNLIKVKNCVFSEVEFENTKVVGVNWMEAMWGKNNLLGSINFTGCTLNYSTFIGLTLKKMKLIKCLAKDVDFAEADL